MNGPIAIRYPRGRGSKSDWKQKFSTIEIGKGRTIRKGKNMALLTIGPIGEVVRTLCKKEKYLNLGHYDMRFAKPLDEDLLNIIYTEYDQIITIEEGTVRGGFGEAVLAHANRKKVEGIQIEILGIPDLFVEHGNIKQLNNKVGLDGKSIETLIDNIIIDKNY